MLSFLKKLFGASEPVKAEAPYKVEAPVVEAAPVAVDTSNMLPVEGAGLVEVPAKKPRAKKPATAKKPRAKKAK